MRFDFRVVGAPPTSLPACRGDERTHTEERIKAFGARGFGSLTLSVGLTLSQLRLARRGLCVRVHNSSLGLKAWGLVASSSGLPPDHRS